jgi:hypothetical protein
MSFKGVEINGKTRKKRMTDTWRPSVFFKIWMGGIAERFVVEENSLWYLFSLKKKSQTFVLKLSLFGFHRFSSKFWKKSH